MATFYTMYKRKPVGEYHVGVCINTLCAVMGGDQIWDELREHVGVGHDETTADGKVSLERLECNAACDFAPVMMVNWEFFDNRRPSRPSSSSTTCGPASDGRPDPRRRRGCAPARGSRVLAGLARRAGGRRARRPAGPSLAGLQARQGRRAGRPPTPERGADVTTPHAGPDRELGPSPTPSPWRPTGARRVPGAAQGAGAWTPDEVIQAVKDSGLRGRGGAGFPTGMKWGFIPQGDGKPHYLVVNADESEPGTCKDIPLMMANPHALVEGVIITRLRDPGQPRLHLRARRGAARHPPAAAGRARRRTRRVTSAPTSSAPATTWSSSCTAAPGAYICGEETALLDSLEGFRGQPRLKPPFPAVAGLYACPTVVNNVESIASVPSIIDQRRRLVRRDGHREVQGLRHLLAVRPRHPARPVRGAARHHAARAARHGGRHPGRAPAEVLDAGRLVHPDLHRRAPGRAARLRVAWAPPGRCSAPGRCRSSTRRPAWSARCCAGPSSTRTSRAASARRAGRAPTGSSRCSSGWRTARAPRRTWTRSLDICDNILGRSFCALGDGATSPIKSSVKYFRDEYIQHFEQRRLPVRPGRSPPVWG